MGDTKPRQIRIPDDLWQAYQRVCAGLGRTRAEDVLGHIRRQVRRHGSEQDRAALVRADAELAGRRARRPASRCGRGGRPA